jgi:hypothetical protein
MPFLKDQTFVQKDLHQARAELIQGYLLGKIPKNAVRNEA